MATGQFRKNICNVQIAIERGNLLIYRLLIYDRETKTYKKKSDYKTRRIAETKAKPLADKGRNIKVIAIPTTEIKIGMKLYLHDGNLYGEIIDESESFLYVRRASKGEDDRMFFLKDNFIDKYENEVLVMKEELNEG